jgi:hypothetical protein
LNEQVVSIISNLGFPIFVSVFVLFRLEKSMKDFTQSINDLSEKLNEIIKG